MFITVVGLETMDVLMVVGITEIELVLFDLMLSVRVDFALVKDVFMELGEIVMVFFVVDVIIEVVTAVVLMNFVVFEMNFIGGGGGL